MNYFSIICCGLLLGGCSSGEEILKPRVDQFKIHDRATEGIPVQSLIEEFGEPHHRERNAHGGETLVYKTYVDWDKFIAHHVFRIETDESGRIIKAETENDED